jgi:superfamily II DNA or RNA helicase
MTPDELSAKRAELASKQRELELEIAKLNEIERQNQTPPRVTITGAKSDRITFELDIYDESIVAIFRSIPTRAYHGNKVNSIECVHLEKLEAGLKSHSPPIELLYASDEARNQVEELVNRPNWKVSLDGRGNRLRIEPAPSMNSQPFLAIPGHSWNHELRYWTIPVWEGWRVHQYLKTQEKVEWTDEAIKLVEASLEKRAELEGIASQKDADLDLKLEEWELKPYQKVGILFAMKSGYRCIIADKPGLGKTVQFIGAVRMLERELGRPVRAAVFCPANAKRNWAVQINKFTNESSTIYRGLEPRPLDVVNLLDDTRKPKWAIFNYDILGRRTIEQVDEVDKDGRHIQGEVTKYLWMQLINASQFDIVAIDEAHYINNVDSHRSQAVRKLLCPRVIFLSATPVRNRPTDLWPMLYLINSDLFPSHEVFAGSYQGDHGTAINSAELVELLKPIMIRRTHKDVMADLPPINRVYEFYELSPKAQKIYNRILEGIYEDIVKNTGQESAITSILTQIMRLKQVCAIDKMDAVAELATDLYDGAGDEPNPKVLIFSQFVPVARGIAKRLGQEALIVTGEVSQELRPSLVAQFQDDPSIHFMVSTKGTLSEALDLTRASYVIFADLFWTPASHEQAEGRAFGRVSDAHSITSYYCTAKQENGEESIEDWIQQILARKLATIETVVDGVEGARNASIANELFERIKQELFAKKGR